MLHSLIVAIALMSSPTQWCGGGGGCCIGFRVNRPPVAPAPIVIAPPKVDVLKFMRMDQYPQPVRVGLAIIAPRPLSNAMISTLQVEALSE